MCNGAEYITSITVDHDIIQSGVENANKVYVSISLCYLRITFLSCFNGKDFSRLIAKQNLQYYAIQVLHAVLSACYPWPATLHHIVM